MAVIGQRNNFRLGFWAFKLMEESSEPCATLSRKISGSQLHRTAAGAPIARRLMFDLRLQLSKNSCRCRISGAYSHRLQLPKLISGLRCPSDDRRTQESQSQSIP
jgi:hypothetical protein